MGAGYVHKCDRCGHSVETSGPWEFYRDAEGKIKEYGHPGPVSREAEDAGVYGFTAILYCPTCDKTFEAVLVEFKEPCKFVPGAWTGRCEPKEEFTRPNAVKCSQCGKVDLLLGPAKENPPTCPRCKQGKLVGQMEWIS